MGVSEHSIPSPLVPELLASSPLVCAARPDRRCHDARCGALAIAQGLLLVMLWLLSPSLAGAGALLRLAAVGA